MENKITLTDLTGLLAGQAELTNSESELFLKTFFDLIAETLSNDDLVKIKNFGTFKLTRIQARESVDVNSGEKIEIPAHNRVSFVPSTVLKELVNKPFSHFETILVNDGVNFENIEQFFDTEEEQFEFPIEQEDEIDDKPGIIQENPDVIIEEKKEIIPAKSTKPTPVTEFSDMVPAKQSSRKFPAILIPVLGGVALAFASFLVNEKRRK